MTVIPLGRDVDLYNRRNLVSLSVLAWTLLTIWSGLAGSFAELFFARAGIGIAEAILAPATYSIIADCFPPRMRARAIGLYFSCLIVGRRPSFIIGSPPLSQLAPSPIDLPLFVLLSTWPGPRS